MTRPESDYLLLYRALLDEVPTGDIGVRVIAFVEQLEKDNLPASYIKREVVRMLYLGVIYNRWPR